MAELKKKDHVENVWKEDTSDIVENASVGWGIGAAIGGGFLAYLVPQIILGILAAIYVANGDNSIADLTENQSPLLLLAVSSFISILGAAIVWLIVRNKGGLKGLGFQRTSLKHMLYIIPVYVAYFMVLIGVLAVVTELVSSFDVDQEQDLGFETLKNNTEYIAGFIMLVVLAPIFEELLFRGFVFQGIAKQFGFWSGALVTSGLFGLAHGQFNVGIDTFVLGIAASWLVWKSKSLWPAIGLHALKNFVAYISVFIIGVN